MTTAPDAAPVIPTALGIGEELRLTVDGEEIVVVGAAPAGHPVILTPSGWRTVRRWKFSGLTTGSGHVCATAKGYGGRPLVSRLLTATVNDASKEVRHRNGNLLDCRESNLLVLPRSLINYARIMERRPPDDDSPFVRLRDGRIRAKAKRTEPTATERLERLIRGT